MSATMMQLTTLLGVAHLRLASKIVVVKAVAGQASKLQEEVQYLTLPSTLLVSV